MMKRGMSIAVGFGTVFLLVVVGSEVLAYVGSDPVIPQSCTLTSVTAEFGPDGSIRYDIMGTCGGGAISGQMAYATNQQMQERFYYGGIQISTKAMCPADPWATGAQCQDQNVYAKDGNPGALINYSVPLSRGAVGSAQAFQNARANAARPKPPGQPVNAKAAMRLSVSTVQRATISWLGPDQQGNFGPFLNFIVEARPQKAEGAAWIRLGMIPRHQAPDYQLVVQLPPAVQGTDGWELRTCSTTVFASTCTGPMIPTEVFSDKLERVAPGSFHGIGSAGKTPINPQQLPGTSYSESIQSGSSAVERAALNPQPLPPIATPGLTQNSLPGQNAALNPQPLPPKALSSSIEQRPSLGGNAALNPQPLPPKAFNAPRASQFLNAPIMRRGVPQEESTPAATTPAETKPAP